MLKKPHINDFQKILNTLKCKIVTPFKHFNDVTDRRAAVRFLKLIKPDGFPDFFYHTFESTCKNKGANGTARALRVVPAFNKVGVLAALNIV